MLNRINYSNIKCHISYTTVCISRLWGSEERVEWRWSHQHWSLYKYAHRNPLTSHQSPRQIVVVTIHTMLFSATRSQTDEAYKRDYKFLMSDKENVSAKKEPEMLILAKDSGKQFTSSTVHVGGSGGESDTAPCWTNSEVFAVVGSSDMNLVLVWSKLFHPFGSELSEPTSQINYKTMIVLRKMLNYFPQGSKKYFYKPCPSCRYLLFCL